MADSFNPYTQNSDKDKDLDGIIRPQGLDEFTGQKEIVSNLEIYIKAAKNRGDSRARSNGFARCRDMIVILQ